jgi:hypothetical protein
MDFFSFQSSGSSSNIVVVVAPSFRLFLLLLLSLLLLIPELLTNENKRLDPRAAERSWTQRICQKAGSGLYIKVWTMHASIYGDPCVKASSTAAFWITTPNVIIFHELLHDHILQTFSKPFF